VFVISVFSSYAQDPKTKSTQLDTITLSTSLDAIKRFTTERISSQDIMNNDAVILTPVLNRIAGVNMQQGALNTSRITIRGIGSRSQFSTNRLKLYVNEVPLTDANGESVLDDFDMNTIGSINIIKGPKATNFGGNLGGTIQFSTKTESNPFDLSVGFGSFNRRFISTNASTDLGNTNVQLFYNQIDSDEFRQNSDYERQNLSLFASTNFNKNWSLDHMFIGTRLKAFIPSSLNLSDFESNPENAASNWFESAGFESYNKFVLASTLRYEVADKIQWITSIFLNYRDGFEPRPFDILDEDVIGFGLRSTFDSSFQLKENIFNYQVGVELQNDNYSAQNFDNLYRNTAARESIQGDLVNAFSQNRLRLNAFAQLDFRILEKINVEVGLNLNYASYSTQDEFLENNTDRSSDLTYEPVLLPNLNLAYQASPSLELFGNYSIGIATPTSDESLDSEGFFNTNLNPSYGHHYEAGLLWAPQRSGLTVQLNLFRIDIEDLIVARRIEEDRFIGINAGETTYQGIEFSANYSVNVSDNILFNGYSSLSLNQFEFTDFIDDTEDFSGNRIPAVPDYDANIGFDFLFNSKLNLGLDIEFVDEMPLDDANSLYSEAYSFINFRSSYLTSIFSVPAKVQFGVNNLLDENFAASVLPNAVGFGNNAPRYFYPSLPRHFYFKLLLNLG
jgi:iron complex outermembrane receptor protein